MRIKRNNIVITNNKTVINLQKIQQKIKTKNIKMNFWTE